MTAHNAKGSGNDVEEQITAYLYDSPINASWQTATIYPDSTDGIDLTSLSQSSGTATADTAAAHGLSSGDWVYVYGANQPQYNGRVQVTVVDSDTFTYSVDPSAATSTTGTIRVYDPAGGDQVKTEYDRLGRVTTKTDQRGVVHTYEFDSAGRLWKDRATTIPTGVDDTVKAIVTEYDDIGRVHKVTSAPNDDGSGTARNQVKYVYNGWGRVAREYQEHDGTVNGGSAFVQYDYEDGQVGGVAKYVRLDQVVYPDGLTTVDYDYGSAIDDIMSRLATIGDGTDTYASYKYLGAGRIVTEDYEQIDVKLDYAANDIASLDRFGRVLDQFWSDYGANPDPDHYSYTYNRAGNRTSRDNELHSAFDEDYLYDALNRLTDSDRADAFDQSWTLDGLGNFSTFDDDGTSQDRTVNAANQIQTISGSWVSPEYDAAGNMVFAPKSGDETTGLHFVRDAWNRLTAVYEDDGDGVYEPGTDDALVARYEFDGNNRRIEKTFADDTGVEYFYNQQWQVLEERSVDDQGATTAVNQYVGSPRYIDALVVRFHDGNGDGDLLDAGDNVRYYTTDANFNVTATIDTNDDVVNRYAYSAYGEATVYDDAWSNPAAASEDGPLYCGYWFDSETGNSQVRNREYVTCLSTFDATDPIGYRGGVNRYEYVGDNPVLRTDPNGLFWPEVYDNGKGQVCGYSIFLLTGGWCADPNVVIAATDAYDKYRTCWWDCEVSVHKCVTTYVAEAAAAVCTTAFTHLEIAKGQVRQGLGSPGNVTTLQSALALWMAQHGYKGIGQQLLRRGAQQVSGSVVSSGIKSGVCGVALVELTVSWACAWKCS